MEALTELHEGSECCHEVLLPRTASHLSSWSMEWGLVVTSSCCVHRVRTCDGLRPDPLLAQVQQSLAPQTLP